MSTKSNSYSYPLKTDPETDPKRRETTEDMDISEKEHIYSQIYEIFNQFIIIVNFILYN